MRIKDKSLPCSLCILDGLGFCHIQPIRDSERGAESDSRPACEAPLKMLPLQILCEPRGMDNKWNFNDFRLQILNYLIFMSRNVLHVRCYVRVNSTPQSHFPLQTGGVTLMLILEKKIIYFRQYID